MYSGTSDGRDLRSCSQFKKTEGIDLVYTWTREGVVGRLRCIVSDKGRRRLKRTTNHPESVPQRNGRTGRILSRKESEIFRKVVRSLKVEKDKGGRV